MSVLIILVGCILLLMVFGVVLNFITGVLTGAALLLKFVVQHPLITLVAGFTIYLLQTGQLVLPR